MANTSIERIVHGITVQAQVGADLDPMLDVLMQAVETIPAGDLRAGTSFRMGWCVYELTEVSDRSAGDRAGDDHSDRESDEERQAAGGLQITAPDFASASASDPAAQRSADLTPALWAHVEQRLLLGRLDVRGDTPLYSEKLVYHDGAFTAPAVALHRQEASTAGDSGWFLGIVGQDAEPADLKAIPLWQLLHYRRSLLQAVALPAGWVVGFDGSDVDAVINPEGKAIWQSAASRAAGTA